MHLTSEQAEVMRLLDMDYGPPDHILHESTFEPYGLVWCRWNKGSTLDFQDRNLFIKPDGTRLTWRLMV